ncbi:MAG: alpha amylase C-terminal domain-containing protein [Bacteroidota bacterium]|nr:alpha amylase C-terminal domain-containing protein [Bacteroidota bacterium]
MNKLNLIKNDQGLKPYEEIILQRHLNTLKKETELTGSTQNLSDFASGYLYFGLHKTDEGWVIREWAPNATGIWLIGDFNEWKKSDGWAFSSPGKGIWELKLPPQAIKHGDLFKLLITWPKGQGERLPAWIRRVVQDPQTMIFSAQAWAPDAPYQWKVPNFNVKSTTPIIYEAHIGMATEERRVGTIREFIDNTLPRIIGGGYNTIQLMAVQEHPYYGSFGYHVSNFFAASSRFGTPDELKELIDTAHQHGIAVIMDLVHSHAVKNELEGLNCFDGTTYQYFHSGARRNHPAWDSLCFNYSKNEVLHFLLSNCKFWLDEYHFDGFRFDGITSMLYLDHGLSKHFTSYEQYFDKNQDEDAITYLMLANRLIHSIRPDAITIAEEVSGMPGTASPFDDGGFGFDFRLAMGTPDYWIKIIKELPDEKWDVGELFYELSRKRHDEKTVGYAESHDQALVGDKTLVFRLMDKEIYFHMNKAQPNLVVDRAIALHKIIRLMTIATTGNGYLNFMGNEFGHPEWIDFPREGNNWSYQYARRQWSLVDNKELKYHYLSDFDKAMLHLIKEHNTLEHPEIYMIHENKPAQIIAFKRNDLLFVFNLNPKNSYHDYIIEIDPGKYSIVLNTDSKEYGGNGLVDEKMTYYTNHPDNHLMVNNRLIIYIPSRTGLVFKRTPSKSVYDL